MKSPKSPLLKSLLSLGVAVAATVLFPSAATAQLIAYDDAGHYQIEANWTNNSNQGFGFTPWVIVTNDTGPGPSQFHGNYITAATVTPAFANASITNVAGTTYTNIWGLFANGTNGVHETTAYRGFASPLGTNTFKLQWGSRGAGVTTIAGVPEHGWCGFTLRNGNATNTSSDFQTAARFYLYFLDGAAPSTLYVADGHPNSPRSVPGTSFSDLGRGNITNAVQAEVTVGADGDSYHLVLKDVVANKTLYTLDSTLAGSGTIDSAALFCHQTTGDQVYNRMEISVPRIPPTIVNVVPTNATLYLDVAATNFSFEVNSFASTVVSNDVSVFLNGVPQSNLAFNTAAPASQLLVNFGASLAPDSSYNYVIIAVDANGIATTNSGTFNTFLPSSLFIDAYDYNYGAGQFVNASTPSNSYAGFLGTNGIDYSIADQTGTNNVAGYRPGDLPAILTLNTDATGDPIDHANLRANGYTAYNIGFNDAGNWENYTRVVPATNYSIYARAASVGNGVFEMARLVNPTATTTTQPLAPIGRVNVPPSGGSKVFTGQLTPLTDAFGSTVVLPLSGTNTLRTTSISGQGYNVEYLVVVPVPSADTLRPYIATANPAPNAVGVSTLSKILFNIANRSTTVTNVQLSLNGTNFSGSVLLTNNAAGTIVFFNPTNLPPSFTNTLVAIHTDSTGTPQTNTWTFRTSPVAGNGVWSGGAGPADLSWGTAANWTGGVPGIGNSAVFASAGAATNLATNNIVTVNTSIQNLGYATNNSGFHTTLIADGVTLTVTNATAGTFPAVQVGGTGNNGDNVFNKPVTNTITGSAGTLVIAGNPVGSTLANQLNFLVRQSSGVANASEMTTLDMSGLGTFVGVMGKLTAGQGGTGQGQTNASARISLARTNVITLRRAVAGQLAVGDSSGGAFQQGASTLHLGISNVLVFDSALIGNRKSVGAMMRFNPIFTNNNPSVFIRGTNGSNSRVGFWNVGDVSIEATVPANAQGTVDFTGGSVNALVNTMILGEGATTVTDSGSAQGTLSLSAGTFDVNTLSNGVQRANNTATAAGLINVNGTATLIISNMVLAQAAAGANPALVSGTLNVNGGTVRANIVAGGGISTINLSGGGALAPNSTAGSSAAPLTALNLTNASLRFRADGNATATNIVATTVTTSGTTVITIDSVTNVVGLTTNRLLGYTGTSPFAALSLAPLPGGYTGSLLDSGGTIDLIVNVSALPPAPSISKIIYSGGQIIISGTNNAGAGGTYSLLSSTNLTTPLTNWAVLGSGSFDGSGTFLSTNANTNTLQFFILRVP